MKNEHGSVYVEFSIVVPFFILFVAGLASITSLLGNMAVLIPTSFEAIHAGSGRLGGEGEAAMMSISDQFVHHLARGLQDFEATSSYYTTHDEEEEVSVVEIDLSGGLSDRLPFATLGLNLSLIGPHVGRDLSIENSDFATIGGRYNCTGEICDTDCPPHPCGTPINQRPVDISYDIGEPIQRLNDYGLELPNHDIEGLDW